MTEAERILLQLRDIHEPLPPDGLPTSVWLLTAVALLMVAFFVLMGLRKFLSRNQPQSLIAQHCALAQKEPDDRGRLRLARLLRQQALQQKTGNSIMHTTGEAWLVHLDATHKTTWFTQGEGRQFGDDLYTQTNTALSDDTCKQVQYFLEQIDPAWVPQ